MPALCPWHAPLGRLSVPAAHLAAACSRASRSSPSQPESSAPPRHGFHQYRHPPALSLTTGPSHACMPGPPQPNPAAAWDRASSHLPVAHKPQCTAVHHQLQPAVSIQPMQAATSSFAASQPMHACLLCRPIQAQQPQQPQQQQRQLQWQSLCIAMWQMWGQQRARLCPRRMLWRCSPGWMTATPPSLTGRRLHRRRRGRAR